MYKTKICPICNNEFSPNSARQRYCNRIITRKCVICGKDYNSTCSPTYSMTCSKECSNKYAHQQSQASYKNVIKYCKLCGEAFTPTNNTQVVCTKQHYKVCPICGKSFEIDYHKEIPETCSKECGVKYRFRNGNPFANAESREKAKQTMLEKYGGDHPMHIKEFRDKIDETNMQRYGAKRFTQTSEYLEKAKATNQARYGSDWSIQTEEYKQKAKQTSLERYGVENVMFSEEIKKRQVESYHNKTGYDYPFQNPEVKEKSKQTSLERYGVEHPSQAEEVKTKVQTTMLEKYKATGVWNSPILSEKVKATNLEKYGFENPASSPQIQEKIAKTMLERYGVEHHNASWDYRKSAMTNPNRIEDWKSFLIDPDAYMQNNFTYKPSSKELANKLGIHTTTLWNHLIALNKVYLVSCNELYYSENRVINALKELNPDLVIQQHNRSLIKPYEIDIYLPDYNIGIEVNPTTTHNSTYGAYDRNKVTPPSYHKMKTNMCERQGIFLFHIFGYEWTHKKDIIISMLRNLLGCNENKIYARKCVIKEVSGKEAYDFLQKNHRQGGVHSKIRYGLYYNDELVSLMTFGKLRNTLGIGNDNSSDDCWELVRFCNKLSTSVIGGASRLFNHFIKEYKPKQIRSFSDRAHTKGTLYEILGFKEINRSNEQYVWVNLEDNKAYNRVNAQKHNLRKFFKDDTIDLSKTERQIMIEHGYVQVYDSGTITWQWLENI